MLRRARPSDLSDLHAIFTRMDAMRYWSTPPHESLSQTQDWLAKMIAAPAATSDDYVIEHQGRVIGKAGAWAIPEIGFVLHPDFWRQGLMREALTAVTRHLFLTHPLHHLTAEADPRNAASLGLLTRLGFVETHRAERTMQWGEEWCDSVYLALPRARVMVG
jgi:RimJ/RimL family protein N-acetyltransferase